MQTRISGRAAQPDALGHGAYHSCCVGKRKDKTRNTSSPTQGQAAKRNVLTCLCGPMAECFLGACSAETTQSTRTTILGALSWAGSGWSCPPVGRSERQERHECPERRWNSVRKRAAWSEPQMSGHGEKPGMGSTYVAACALSHRTECRIDSPVPAFAYPRQHLRPTRPCVPFGAHQPPLRIEAMPRLRLSVGQATRIRAQAPWSQQLNSGRCAHRFESKHDG